VVEAWLLELSGRGRVYCRRFVTNANAKCGDALSSKPKPNSILLFSTLSNFPKTTTTQTPSIGPISFYASAWSTPAAFLVPPLILILVKAKQCTRNSATGRCTYPNIIEAKASGESTRVLYATIPPLLETSNGPPGLCFDCSGAKSDQTAL